MMVKVLMGFVISVAVGAVVSFSGLERRLPLEGVVVPPVPESWAALPSGGQVDVTLVRSEALVHALGEGLSSSELALKRVGAIALVDGRVVAVSAASARQLLRMLSWERLPIEARYVAPADLDRFAAPAPAAITWRARRHAYAGLRAAREFLAIHPGFTAGALVTALLLLVYAFAQGFPARHDPSQPEPSAWRKRRALAPVRVVLVSDVHTLAQARVAIGEQHIAASTESAFAFADGWILAVHKGSVFELMSELGWRTRPIETATRPELIADGHNLSPVPSDGQDEVFPLLEALHVCGPLAHATAPHRTTPGLSLA